MTNPQRLVTLEELNAIIATEIAGAKVQWMSEMDAVIQARVSAALLRLARAPRPFKVFGLSGANGYATKVAESLGIKLTPHTEEEVEDGESYVKAGTKADPSPHVANVRGHNVFVVQSLYGDKKESANDKLIKLCWMIGSLKDASAHEVTAVIPYLAYARQDRKTESRAPIATKYLAKMLEAAGASRIVLFDVHNLAAAQNAFSIPIDNLEAKNLFAQWVAEELKGSKKIRVLTPDSGGLNRCTRFRNSLVKVLVGMGRTGMKDDDIEIAIYDKVRQGKDIIGDRIIGDVQDADVVAYDDMISTGGTMYKSCNAVERAGGRVRAICSTHYLGVGKANSYFEKLKPETKIVVTDTAEAFRMSPEVRKRLVVLETTKMVASAVERIHHGTGSISELLT